MKQGSTRFLKGVIGLIGLTVFVICLFVLPPAIKSELSEDFDYGFLFLGLYISAIPFFYALFQAIKLLRLIDEDTAFSMTSVIALRNIKRCAIIISVLFAASLPYALHVADKHDAPEVAGIDMVVAFAAVVIATFAAVLQKLLQNAAEIQSENDLMI